MNTRQTNKWVLSLVLALPGVLRAQQQEHAEVQPPRNEVTDLQDRPPLRADTQSPAESGVSGEPDTRRLAGQLRKLQTAMKQRLDLNRSQQGATDALFATYWQNLRDYRGQRKASGPRSGGLSELKRLREEMRAASRAGDAEGARRFRDQFRKAMRTRMSVAAPTTSQFLKQLSAELDENQRKIFHALVRQLKIGASPSKRDGLAPLWRAVRRPDVALTESQRQAVVSIFRKGFASVAAVRRTGDADAVEQAERRVQEEVFAELTVAQRAKVLAAQARRGRSPAAADWEREPVRTSRQPEPEERPLAEDRKDSQDGTDPPSPVEADDDKADPPPP